jgi:uncharacterized protein
MTKMMSITAVALAMFATPVLADTKAGVDMWGRGDYAGALKEWRPIAINGEADAQFNMGQAYKLGRGVPVDLKLAQEWYRKAAAQGHLQASDNYGLILFQNGDRQSALPYIKASAERGEPRAQYVYGTALFNGDMVGKDWVSAYAMMTRASASGLAPASASLAQMDRYIPLDQRQKGLLKARDLEALAMRPVIEGARPAPRPAASIRTEELPASVTPAPKPTQKPVIVAVAKPKPVAPKPAIVAAPKPASGPSWRVQLGAFGDASRAKALFTSLKGRVSGLGALQPYLVKAGAVTRLQAGPLASKAAAEKQCVAIKAAGQGCLVVAP